jgi:hypothetical protein
MQLSRSLWISFPRINVLEGVEVTEQKAAEEAASRSAPPLLPALDFTESNFEWTLIYNHTRIGQISPQGIRHMKNRDLEYLAGSPTPHSKIDVNEAAKLQGNVTRAARELQRRYTVRTATWSVLLAAAIGAVVARIG